MNIYITLDYELFFGEKSGTVEHCIIQPTNALLELVRPYDIKFSCFVDSGYLLALEKQKGEYPELQLQYEKICQQLKYLAGHGHGIELHIHPHWEDSFYNGDRWVFDTSRYKLADFSGPQVRDIVGRYTDVLRRLSGKAPKAYRAGGWSAQPFDAIGKALAANDIRIDSSVYPGGFYHSTQQVFDFRGVPQYETAYRFSEDLTLPDAAGQFLEIPISSYRVSPLFYWKFVLVKLLGRQAHQPFGDGQAISKSKAGMFQLLTRYSRSVVSIDAYKASFLEKAFNKYRKNTENQGNLVIIGHPKAFTPYSLSKLGQFLDATHGQHLYKIFT